MSGCGTDWNVFLKTLIISSSKIVETSSELISTSSELISTDSELIRIIAELLIISVFKKNASIGIAHAGIWGRDDPSGAFSFSIR